MQFKIKTWNRILLNLLSWSLINIPSISFWSSIPTFATQRHQFIGWKIVILRNSNQAINRVYTLCLPFLPSYLLQDEIFQTGNSCRTIVREGLVCASMCVCVSRGGGGGGIHLRQNKRHSENALGSSLFCC